MNQATSRPESKTGPTPELGQKPAYRPEIATPFSQVPPPPQNTPLYTSPTPMGDTRPAVAAPSRVYYAGTSRKMRWAGVMITAVLGVALVYGGGKYALGTLFGSPTGQGTAIEQSQKHGNGQLPADQLEQISKEYQLVPPAAKQFAAMQRDLEAAGHTLTINSAYRTIAQQQELVDRLGLLEDGGKAAPVGESEHGLGVSVDLTLNFDALTWMNTNAGKYGFERTVENEPWHWTYTQ